MKITIGRRPLLQGLAAAASLMTAPYIARGATRKLTVAKSIPNLMAYTPIDVAAAKGIFAKHDLTVEAIAFSGSAGMHQAMTAGALDIALGSGSTMVNIVKGEPDICIAQTLGPPVELSIIVPYDSAIRATDDLKGKTVGVASTGSPTEWVVFELARLKGWAKTDIKTVGLGGTQASIAALRVHQVDAVVADTAVAYTLEPQKQGRAIVNCADYVPNFIMHANFASTKAAGEQPDAVRAFCAAWLDAVAFMKKNKDETNRIVAPVTTLSAEVQAKNYDLVVPLLSLTGRFDAKGLAALARSYVELKITDTEPDMTKLYTEKFLPLSA
ncbi:MAG TPA: ABC transporter substrate-binding protein [Stellaceae bacterium]|nr:ABC transporter substrate-binding protein [Stellaceae bacterium]